MDVFEIEVNEGLWESKDFVHLGQNTDPKWAFVSTEMNFLGSRENVVKYVTARN